MKTQLKSLKKSALATAIIAASVQTPVQAAAVLEEITVTAQKRSESLQDVAMSVQAVDGDSIAKANISRLQDMSDNMPNVTIGKSSTNARVYVRGIGTDSNAGFEQSVAIFTDGMYMGRGQQSKFPFIDIERVEVLKGPQSILFGKNATAGALNITTKNPTKEFEGEVRVAAGEYGEQNSHLVLSGPLSDNIGGRIALFGRSYDGYLDNEALNRDEEQREEYGARGTLQWDASDNTSVNLKYETGVFYTDGTNYQLTSDPSEAASNQSRYGELKLDDNKSASNEGLINNAPDANKTDLDNMILRVDHDLGSNTLTSVTAYSTYNWENNIDADFSRLPLASQQRDEDFDQISQEVRLVSPGGETLDYVVGAYYQKNNLDIDTYTVADLSLLFSQAPGTSTGGGLNTFEQEGETFAVFGQIDWNFSATMTATLGLRWGRETKDVEDQLIIGDPDLAPSGTGNAVIGNFGGVAHNLDEDRSESHLSPMARLSWDYSDNAMAYISVSRGYKGGGFDGSGLNGSTGTTPDASFEFEEEKVTAIEVGGKMSLQDNAATFNWAVFHSTYEDLQVSTFNDGGFIIGNAAEAEVKGVELEYRTALTEELTASVNAAYLDFEYDEFENAPCTELQDDNWAGAGECIQDLTGETGALTPEVTASANLDYITAIGSNLELRSNLGVTYSDDYNTSSDLDPNLEQDSYVKVNLYLALANMEDSWELALIGKNLTDEEISSAGDDAPASSRAFRRYLEPPRSWTVQATWRF